jgi:uncharacterized membrane protein YbhN (UPF0104 family)
MEQIKPAKSSFNRLKILAAFLTLCGASLFVYFIVQVGFEEIWAGIGRVGFRGFLIVFLIYAVRLGIRAFAWSLSVEEPYHLKFKDSYQAVIIGEAMSSMIPLGIIISGTTKALAVRNKLPLVAGLSSLAIENLFYSFITGLLLSLGAVVLILNFNLPELWYLVSFLLIFIVLVLMIGGIVMIIRQWHFASAIAEWVYQKGFLRKWLETGRSDIKVFENRIYGFYRRQPQRFLPIFSLQVSFHLLGILEVWLILALIGEIMPTFLSAFLLESVERGIVVIFKLVPLAIGVSEAASQFITDTLKLGAAIGVTLPIVRKGVRLSWAIIGIFLLINRGFSIREIFHHPKSLHKEDENLSHQTN